MLNSVPAQMFELHYLTFLAYNTYTSVVIPASMLSLDNLQTLIIYANEPSVLVRLPVEIWKMPRLRHLISSSFHPLPHPDARDPPLETLQILSLATNFVCSERMVEMIPKVSKLGICYSPAELYEEDYHLENLESLDRLEKLKLVIRDEFPFEPSLSRVFPESLKKLTLSGGRRPWEDLSVVGSLPNLRVLKLRNYACDGNIWTTNENEFEKLEYLLIDESNLEELSTESRHFPKLKQLMLHRCPSLHEIPDDVGDFASLEVIEVVG